MRKLFAIVFLFAAGAYATQTAWTGGKWSAASIGATDTVTATGADTIDANASCGRFIKRSNTPLIATGYSLEALYGIIIDSASLWKFDKHIKWGSSGKDTLHVGAGIGTGTIASDTLNPSNSATPLYFGTDKTSVFSTLTIDSATTATCISASNTSFNSAVPLIFKNGGALTYNSAALLTFGLTASGRNIKVLAGTPVISGSGSISLSVATNNNISDTIDMQYFSGAGTVNLNCFGNPTGAKLYPIGRTNITGMLVLTFGGTASMQHIFGSDSVTCGVFRRGASAAGATSVVNYGSGVWSITQFSYQSDLGTNTDSMQSVTINCSGAGGAFSFGTTHKIVPGTSTFNLTGAQAINNQGGHFNNLNINAGAAAVDSMKDKWYTAGNFSVTSGRFKFGGQGPDTCAGNMTLGGTDSIYCRMARVIVVFPNAATFTNNNTMVRKGRMLDSLALLFLKNGTIANDSQLTKSYVQIAPGYKLTLQALKTDSLLKQTAAMWPRDSIVSSSAGNQATVALAAGLDYSADTNYYKDIAFTPICYDTGGRAILGGNVSGLVIDTAHITSVSPSCWPATTTPIITLNGDHQRTTGGRVRILQAATQSAWQALSTQTATASTFTAPAVTPGWDTIQFDNGSNVYTRYAVRLLALRDTIRSTQAVTSAGYHYGIFGVGTGATVTFADNPFQCSTYVQLAGTATLPTRDSVFTYFDVEGGTCVVSGDTVVVGGDVAFAAGVTVTSNAASYMIFSKQCPTITTNGVTLPTYVILNPCVASSIRKIYWQSFYNRTYRNDAYKNSSWR